MKGEIGMADKENSSGIVKEVFDGRQVMLG